MKRYRVTIGLCQDDNVSRQYFITAAAASQASISKAIRKLAGKKYVKELIEKVER